jgi:asparagine synthase (glutamine-hydrolysing)
VCGIAGKISFDEPIERSLLERMCSVIEHRGPDSRGVYVDKQAGLGIQRLAIIDLETGDQPIFNEDGSVVIVLNGEIYNYRELRDALEGAGHSLTTRSDTEVIVHLYEDYGDECVRMLRGMFAFALWDTRLRRLLLARDRIGKKPLYYSVTGNTLWFASEAKAILQDHAVSRQPDYQALDAYLQYQHVPDSYCAFAALSKVQPAHVLLFGEEGLRTRRYWKLSFCDQLQQPYEESCELIRSQLLEATRLRLRSDVPLGAFLSGGVDSSAVVAAMAQQSPQRLRTFTIGFPDAQVDERSSALQIAQLFDTEHHELVVEPRLVDVLPRLAWHYSEPFADQSAIPTFLLSEMTRKSVTVALNGDGGDETFGGYRRYIGNDIARRLEMVPRTAAGASVRLLRLLGTGAAEDSSRARLMRLARGLQFDAAARYASWISCFDADERRRLYTSEFADYMRTSNADCVVGGPFQASDAPTLIERLLDVDTQTFLPGQLLVKVDIASMAHSLEVRSPLLDHEFVETAARIPLEAKVLRGRTKRLLKDAVRKWIPGDHLDRPKQGFTMPIAQWFRSDLRDLPVTILLDGPSTHRGMFDLRTVGRLIDDHHRGAADNSQKLWTLVQLELWFRTYVDAQPSGPVSL